MLQQLGQQPGAEAGAPVVAGDGDGLYVAGAADGGEPGVADEPVGRRLGDDVAAGGLRAAGVGQLGPEHPGDQASSGKSSCSSSSTGSMSHQRISRSTSRSRGHLGVTTL